VYGKDRDTFNGKANELLEAIRIERDIWDQAVAIRPSLSSFMRLPILTSVRHSLMFNTPWPFLIYLPSSTTPSTRVSPLEKVQSVHVLMTTKCLSPTISNYVLPSQIRFYQQYYAYRMP